MEKIDLNEGGTPLPVWLLDFTDDPKESRRGLWLTFQEPEVLIPLQALGPFSSRNDAVATAQNIAHEVVRLQAIDNLHSFGAHQ